VIYLLILLNLTKIFLLNSLLHLQVGGCSCPLSSDRQHLSYDVCLELRGEIIGTVLYCVLKLCTVISTYT